MLTMLRTSGPGWRVLSANRLAAILSGLAFSVLLTAASGCGALHQTIPFAPLDHLTTTQPLSLAEGGHSSSIAMPPGVGFDATLTGVVQDGAPAYSPRYEFEVRTQDDRLAASDTSAHPIPESALLVDDDGERFVLCRVLEPLPSKHDAGTTAKRFRLDFRIPPTYRFNAISRVTVHWQLAVEGHGTIAISSRFRR